MVGCFNTMKQDFNSRKKCNVKTMMPVRVIIVIQFTIVTNSQILQCAFFCLLHIPTPNDKHETLLNCVK